MRVGIYLRVSTGEQTVANQERELGEAAARHGWGVAATYRDEGVSGAKGRLSRPGFDRLCKAIVRREIDMVAAWSVDRLGRSQGSWRSFRQAAVNCIYINKASKPRHPLVELCSACSRSSQTSSEDDCRTDQGWHGEGKGTGEGHWTAQVASGVEDAVRASLADGMGICRTARVHRCGVGTVQRIKRTLQVKA
jgi:hypothetical protein